ncbi:hypothetical protein ADK41_10080 [Streptomyces caelestis]|uniref:Uncharacterized protein n=1 Tax=Streptomyces caelestis TaxID=36816 RepID=A0A0M8QKE5_9ACTN|nr:hypothetical protein ADK41_10080 [Streptomyces caelestis]
MAAPARRPAVGRLPEAGAADAGPVPACTSRDEADPVTAGPARRPSSARTVVRATGTDHPEARRAGDLDGDLRVSTASGTASAVERVPHVPGAPHADFFARGGTAVLGVGVRGADRSPSTPERARPKPVRSPRPAPSRPAPATAARPSARSARPVPAHRSGRRRRRS